MITYTQYGKVSHLTLIRVKKGIDLWMCPGCNEAGSYDDLQKVDCTEDFKPCKHCGEVHTCAPDCSGVLEALNGEGIYLSGGGD